MAFPMQVAEHQVVVGRHFCTSFTRSSNTEWYASAETSVIMWADLNPSYPGIVPNVYTKVSQKDRGFVSLTLHRASLISTTNFEHSALELGPYICTKHRERLKSFNINMHTLPPNGIYSSTQFVSFQGLRRLYPLQPRQTLLTQRRNRRVSLPAPSVRTTTLSRWDTNKIQWIPFGFVKEFVLFRCERSGITVSSC